MIILNFIRRYPLLAYFILTFAISWGGFIAALGPGGFTNTNVWQEASFGFAVMAMLLGPSMAGLLMIGITDGKAGFSKLLSNLLRWRLKVRWYAIALLPAPILSMIALFLLSLSSPIFSADNKIAILFTGIAAGLTTIFEEIGWTGFAVPRLRRRYSVFASGVILGVIWGAWHLLQQIYISGTYAGGLSFALYFSFAAFNTVAGLTAYRVLLVWINDRTESLLATTLMHASLTASNIFIFRPDASGISFLIFGLLFAAVQWLFVMMVVFATRGKFHIAPFRL